MYFICPGQKEQGNTNREHQAPVFPLKMLIHTYIHNWPLQPFSQDYGLVSHTTHVVCVNFIRELSDLQFNVNSERLIFWEAFSWQIYLLSELLARNLLRRNRRRNTFRILLWCLAWDSNPIFSSNKPTHHLLDHGDFIFEKEV